MASKALVSGTALLMSLIILCNGIAEADSYCETFTYSNQPVVLAVPEEYYALPRRADSVISLMVRYKDLTAPARLRDGYDASELADPTWTLARSNYTALLQIRRHDVKPSSTFAELAQSYPRLREAVSDWPGWTRLEECPTGCQQVFYLSETWRKLGVHKVLCYEVENRSPLRLGCGVSDYVEGLHIVFYFPSAKKAHFAEFRERIATLIHRFAADGAENCAAE